MKKDDEKMNQRINWVKNKMRRAAGLLISCGIGLSSVADAAQTKALVEGNTAFALDLYARLAGAPGNLFFSPYSISTCLAMTYAGARGNTASQMSHVFHFADTPAELPGAFASLQR